MMTLPSKQQIFIDTNILYYADTPDDPLEAQAATRLQSLLALQNQLIVSPQILREYANVCFRNAIYHRMNLADMIETVCYNIACFQRDFLLIYEDESSVDYWTTALSKLQSSKDVFDFTIAATMKANDISYILTHNTRDFIAFSDWMTCIPLFDQAIKS